MCNTFVWSWFPKEGQKTRVPSPPMPFPIFHIDFEIRHDAVKFLLCNPSYTLLVRQVMRHVIIEPVGIRDNDINHPFQIVEEAG